MRAKFKVLLQAQPEKYFRKTDGKTAKGLETCFRHLEENPVFLPGRIKRLKGYDRLYRYRLGNLRVIYEINLEAGVVGVVAILPRGDVYKKI